MCDVVIMSLQAILNRPQSYAEMKFLSSNITLILIEFIDGL
jgi:hypothetical protein